MSHRKPPVGMSESKGASLQKSGFCESFPATRDLTSVIRDARTGATMTTVFSSDSDEGPRRNYVTGSYNSVENGRIKRNWHSSKANFRALESSGIELPTWILTFRGLFNFVPLPTYGLYLLRRARRVIILFKLHESSGYYISAVLYLIQYYEKKRFMRPRVNCFCGIENVIKWWMWRGKFILTHIWMLLCNFIKANIKHL